MKSHIDAGAEELRYDRVEGFSSRQDHSLPRLRFYHVQVDTYDQIEQYANHKIEAEKMARVFEPFWGVLVVRSGLLLHNPATK